MSESRPEQPMDPERGRETGAEVPRAIKTQVDQAQEEAQKGRSGAFERAKGFVRRFHEEETGQLALRGNGEEERLGPQEIDDPRRLREYMAGAEVYEVLRKSEDIIAIRHNVNQLLGRWESERLPQGFYPYDAKRYEDVLLNRVIKYNSAANILTPEQLQRYHLRSEEITDEMKEERRKAKERGEKLPPLPRPQPYDTDLEGDELREFAEGLVEIYNLFAARLRLLELHKLQAEADVDPTIYLVNFFRGRRPEMLTHHYKAIFEAGKIVPEDEMEFGQQVSRALVSWWDIAEGRAGIRSPFGEPSDDDHFDAAKKYILENNPEVSRIAVNLAYKLILHWDGHGEYNVVGGKMPPLMFELVRRSRAEMGDDPVEYFDPRYLRRMARINTGKVTQLAEKGKLSLSQEDLEKIKGPLNLQELKRIMGTALNGLSNLNLDVNGWTAERSKAARIAMRMLARFSRYRDEYEVAPPALIGCLPNLTTDFTRFTTLTLLDQDGKPTGIKHSLFDLAYGIENPETGELNTSRRISLRDFPWDGKGPNDKDGEWTHPVTGEKYKVELPADWHTALYLLHGSLVAEVYGLMTNTEYAKLVSETITSVPALRKLNNPFAEGVGTYLKQIGLEGIRDGLNLDHTRIKLIQLTKVITLAAHTIATTIPEEKKSGLKLNRAQKLVDIARVGQLTYEQAHKITQDDEETYLEQIKGAAINAGYFSHKQSLLPLNNSERIRIKVRIKVKDEEKDLVEVEETLFDYLVKVRRMGVTPSALRAGTGVDGRPDQKMPQILRELFSDQEIQIMLELGIFHPFKP